MATLSKLEEEIGDIFQFHWMDSDTDDVQKVVDFAKTSFNSIEWIPASLPVCALRVSSLPFNSIEWIPGRCPSPRAGMRSWLSIPLNGFLTGLKHGEYSVAVYFQFHWMDSRMSWNGTGADRIATFNSIEWILQLYGGGASWRWTLIFQFHWMDSSVHN